VPPIILTFLSRFQKELEQLRNDVAKWQSSPDGFISPIMTPNDPSLQTGEILFAATLESDKASLDRIPPLDALADSTGLETRAPEAKSTLRERG